MMILVTGGARWIAGNILMNDFMQTLNRMKLCCWNALPQW